MKKFIFMGVIGLFLLGSCNSKSGEGHNHETEEHAHAGHDHEGHDHESENHDHEHEGAGHEHEHAAEAAAGHSDEIILPPAKAPNHLFFLCFQLLAKYLSILYRNRLKH